MQHRDLLLGGAAVVGAATLTFAMLMTRPTPASESSAGRVISPPTPVTASEPAVPGGAAPWSDANASMWLGARHAGVAFEVRAERPIGVWMRAVHPVLVVRCTGGTINAFVVTESAAQIEANTEDHTVTFAFDGEAETRERWQDSSEHDALFAPDGSAFAKRLMQARTLRFAFTPHNATTATARFHVAGLEPLLTPAAKTCGWK
jgi:hypothetical protein